MDAIKTMKYIINRRFSEFRSLTQVNSVWFCDYGNPRGINFLFSQLKHCSVREFTPDLCLSYLDTCCKDIMSPFFPFCFALLSIAEISAFSDSQQWSVINHLLNSFRVKGPLVSND